MSKQWSVLLVALVAGVAIRGCGSNSDSGGSSSVTTPASVAAVGIANCTTCHESYAQTQGWVNGSAHGNANNRPDLSYFGNDPNNCVHCHDPSGESQAVASAFRLSTQTSRAVVGCEECHGGGSAHRGVGPMPFPRPDWEQCTQCHDNAHDDIALGSAVGASAHNNSDDLHASTALCQRCHTSEGAVALSAYTGDADIMHLMDDLAPLAAEEDLHPVTCSTCHMAHSGALRADSFIVNDNSLASGNWDPNGNGTPDQFDFCTSCHSYYNQDGVLIGSGSTESRTAPFYHNTAWYRTLTTTHYDNPATGPTTGDGEALIEGYNIRTNSNNPCFDCHGHEFRANTRNFQEEADASNPDLGSTIHTQWASSAHAGRLLKQVAAAAETVECDPNDPETSRGRCPNIVDAAMAAGVDDSTGAAWTHYNWDREGRQGCQECHTATGAMNYLNDPDNYDAKNNDFSHLSAWSASPADGSPQNELLYCWGCHSSAQTGELRNTGAISRPYAVGGVRVTLADLGNSNVCVNCHGAQGNMDEYGLAEDPATDMASLKPGFGPGTKNVTEAHYLVASATLYASKTRIGYEYAGQSYADVPYFAHDTIGLNSDSPETGSGPCVACHMQTAESHLFEVVNKDDNGVITALNATSCASCHNGEHGPGLVVTDTTTAFGLQTSAAAAAFLEKEAEGYHEALEILNQALVGRGVIFTGSCPYFSADSWINEGNFGAAHNYNYLHHEPGAYAHNRFYAKRLIFDSIDWVDNYVLDGSIMIDEATYPEAAHWLGADPTTGVTSRP
jgi:mono/diheme cytochrome c family protein